MAHRRGLFRCIDGTQSAPDQLNRWPELMTSAESRAHTFIVRMHRTVREADQPGMWLGEVIHVPSQQAVSFIELRNVPDAIYRLIDDVERRRPEVSK